MTTANDFRVQTCEICDSDLEHGKKQNKYCSRECAGAALGLKNGPALLLTCLWCEKEYPFRRGSRGVPKRPTCSRECKTALGRSQGSLDKSTGYYRVYVNGPGEAPRTKPRSHVVMEKMIGRPVAEGETVHHKNGIRHDDRPENLELWTGNHGAGVRVADIDPRALVSVLLILGSLFAAKRKGGGDAE